MEKPLSTRFPMQLTNVRHRHGGTITRIDRCDHQKNTPRQGRSMDVWFFVGNVEWDDGSRSQSCDIMPWALVWENDESEVRALMECMNQYLRENGEWCDEESGHEGWFANRGSDFDWSTVVVELQKHNGEHPKKYRGWSIKADKINRCFVARKDNTALRSSVARALQTLIDAEERAREMQVQS